MVSYAGFRQEFQLTKRQYSVPSIPVQTHNNPLDASSILWVSALGEKLIYLLLCGIKTQVTNLPRVQYTLLKPQ